VLLRKRELNFAGIAKKTKPVKSGGNTETQVKSLILSNVIKNLRRILLAIVYGLYHKKNI
jgi:hypothetical protein